MEKEKIVLFGTSAGAVQCHYTLTHDSPYEVVAYTVDRSYITEERLKGLPVVPFEEIESIFPPNSYKMLVAVLASRVNKTRAEKYDQAKAKGYEMIRYISTRALTWPDLVVGDNCVIHEGAICRPFAKIGNNVSILPGAFIGPDAVIKDHCYIGPRAVVLGAVTVEPYCVIGANSTILDGVTIARECVIGAGSFIHENTKEKEVYRVNPPSRLPLTSDKLENILFRRRQG
jgi:sugar O-acyltransferase (sialic acid O-acetyltransferase NeuD family)